MCVESFVFEDTKQKQTGLFVSSFFLGVRCGGNCSAGVHWLSNNPHYSEVWKTL